MITDDDKLQVFESFRVDYDLPKYARRKAEKDKASYEPVMSLGSGSAPVQAWNSMVVRNNPVVSRVSTGHRRNERAAVKLGPYRVSMHQDVPDEQVLLSPSIKREPWIKRAWKWAFGWTPEDPPETITIPQFFAHCQNSASELTIIYDRAKGYERAMLSAKQGGQTALYERLESGLAAYKAETQMLAAGVSRCLSEADVVRFYKASPRGLRLDWIANFTRVVPDDVMSKKLRADELELFDNWVVLHYDPDTKAYAVTEAERKAIEIAKGDPILFGVNRGKRLLYFVGDWIDATCDLTLDQIADKLGKDVVRDAAAFEPGDPR